LHNILTELYYLPLLLGTIAFGFKGAVYSFIFVTFLYTPYVLINWTGTDLFVVNKLLHAVFSGFLTTVAGILIDRAKKIVFNWKSCAIWQVLGRLLLP